LTLPAGTRRLFAHWDEGDLTPGRASSLILARVLEDGDAADLAWLFSAFPEAEIAGWIARHGGRRLSRRSRAFWSAALGVNAGPPRPESEALWPL
jgi:hypothetical protein